MRRKFVAALMVSISILSGAYSAIAQEKLVLAGAYDEMPRQIQNSETIVEQLYVQEKRSFDTHISQKNTNPKVPLYQYKKLAPSADVQKQGIKVVE